MIEWIGYAASIMVALSLTMKDILRLRVLNTLGAVLFVIYAMNIDAWPVLTVNAFIVCVNGYYLLQMRRSA